MSDPRVMELLEGILESGRTPEEVCADCPELLWEVRERLKRCLGVDVQVDAIFPTSHGTPAVNGLSATDAGTDLPRIPGYEVESVLGRGGMGVVYRATQLALHRTVALKMILAGAYARAPELARFTHEAEVVASLRHAHVVQVYDAGDFEGLPYFTMEYIDGGTLAQKLGGAPQPAHEAAGLVSTLARAVQAAHDAGIVHRDLKPANILLTAEGTPKITDFGLARHLGEDQTVTLAGARVGTPSYMSPEQAAGKEGAIGPRADVYALGAILYELLTGRPPFRAETASATVHQVIHDEPAPPSRLNAKVPRDLETICLMCLQKDPERRYASAAALADDLTRFREGRPIHARPPSWGGRAWRWARREPAAAALVATVLATAALAVGGGFWVQRQQAASRAATALREQAVEDALEHAQQLIRLGHWPEARRALQGAPQLLGTSVRTGLRERLVRARADADIVVLLEDVRLKLSEGNPAGGRSSPVADRLYAEAFATYGITLEGAASDVARLVEDSQVSHILLVFLHDWLYWAPAEHRSRLREVVDLADRDPWRRAFRDARVAGDIRKLEELANAPEVGRQPAALLSGLGGALLADGQPPVALALLRTAHHHYPGDFWINYLLGHALERERPQEAVSYFRAAVALRPRSDQANARLLATMNYLGDSDTAIAALQQAVALNPSRAGMTALVKALAPRGRLEEVRAVWEKMLAGDPADHDLWYGYAQLCLMLENAAEYRRSRDAMLRRFQDSDDWIIAERASLASLLLPGPAEELWLAAALAERAVAAASKSSEPDNAYVQFAMGLAEYRLDRLDQAVPLLRESARKIPSRPGPRLVLAMAEFRSGAREEARKSLAAAVAVYDWKQLPDDFPSVWTSHLLRREAEAMILPNLQAFLDGTHQPQDTDERLALLAICQVKGLYGVCAQLYTDAFAADPAFAEASTADCLRRAGLEKIRHDRIYVLKTEPRYLAARCAALAGCGLGEDGPKLDDAERTRWRRQALEWLRADLAAWVKTLASDSAASRDLAKEMLTLWLVEPDVARLREPGALQLLPAEERAEWDAFWSEVRLALREVR